MQLKTTTVYIYVQFSCIASCLSKEKNTKQQILLMPYHVPKCLCDSTILYMFMYTFFTLRHVKGPNTRA